MSLKLIANATYHLRPVLTGLIFFIFLAPRIGIAADHLEVTGDTFNEAVAAVRAKDFVLANDLFFILSEQDDHDAQYNLAILLKSGEGTPQNFTQALEWAYLAKLGGVERATDLTETLMQKVLPDTQADVALRIDEHLLERLATGERAAIMQYVAFNRTKYANPDLETAYIWSVIGAALSISGASGLRDEIESNLETSIILSAQDTAQKMFSEQEMINLFN
jgi:TPR repeat protein